MGKYEAEATNSGLVQLSDAWYDLLRAFVEKIFPGLGVLYATFAAIWHWGYGIEVGGSCAALAVFGGIILSLSRKGYTPPEAAEPVGDFVVNTTDVDAPPYRFELDKPLEDVEAKQGQRIAFNVKEL